MAIIQRFTRPALPVALGSYITTPPEWELLDEHRPVIDHAIACVGRIELEDHPYLQWAGTGTLVGPYAFLTAGYVAALFAEGSGANARLRKDVHAVFTAGESTGSTTEFRLPVTGVRFVHPYFDVALCELGRGETSDMDEDSELGVPTGLPLAADEPAEMAGRRVCVIGFAAPDPRNEPEDVERIFGMELASALYVMPGEVLSVGDDVTRRPGILHDCSTLGGSGGAPLLDLESGQVLGIHHAGRYLAANYATPAFLLARDRRVRATPIRFSDDPEWLHKWAIADLDDGATAIVPLPSDPPAPVPDLDVHYFKQAELYRIRDMLVATGLARPDRFHLLFVAMSTGFIASLPTDGAPDARLLTTLGILNTTPPLASGEVPFRILLVNAVENSKEFPQSETLRTFLDLLPAGT